MGRIFEERLTFDDALLLPSYSEVLPSEVDFSGFFCKKVSLKLPVASAPMDTVTESETAIAMALQGGIGVIHKNMPVAQQVEQVKRTKRQINFVVTDPITISPATTLSQVKALVAAQGSSSFPVVENGKLVGMLTSRDFRFEKNSERRVIELMTKQVVYETVNNLMEFSPEKAIEVLQRHRIEKLPLTDSQGKLLGLVTYRDLTVSTKYPQATRDCNGRLVVAAAVSPLDDARAQLLVEAGVDCLVVDSAHGNSKNVVEAVTRFCRLGVPIVAGNVCTADGAKRLIDAGASGVKVGIGAGSICTTRIISGCGSPQLSSILDCASACHEAGIPLIADGGIKYSGDAAKALAAGASCVMLGNFLAGTEESPGRAVIIDGKKFKKYRGMGSLSAMEQGSKDRYFQSSVNTSKKLVPEGIDGVVPFKGTIEETLYQLQGGIRSAMGYCGASNLADFWKSKFVRITHAGNVESHPHDVMITEEAPNYRR